MELTVYIKPWCTWCVEALKWLDARGIAYRSVDVLTDAAAYAHMRKISGQSLTPTMETSDGLVLADFDVGQLEKFLNTHNIAAS
jgi:glutaredoxin 3